MAESTTGVRERFEEYGLDARAFAGVKVAAVGEQTSKALLDFGIRPDLVPDGDQSAEGLAAVRALGKVKPRTKPVETILDSAAENDDDPRVREEAAAALAKDRE